MNNNIFFYLLITITIIIFFFFYNFKSIESYKNNSKYWGIDYHGSLQNDNYWVPQLNMRPSHIFYESDYNET